MSASNANTTSADNVVRITDNVAAGDVIYKDSTHDLHIWENYANAEADFTETEEFHRFMVFLAGFAMNDRPSKETWQKFREYVQEVNGNYVAREMETRRRTRKIRQQRQQSDYLGASLV